MTNELFVVSKIVRDHRKKLEKGNVTSTFVKDYRIITNISSFIFATSCLSLYITELVYKQLCSQSDFCEVSLSLTADRRFMGKAL